MRERNLTGHLTSAKTSGAASLRCACCHVDESQVPCGWVEHSEIKSVRKGVTCVTLPEAAECKAFSVLPQHIVKQCHYTVLIVEPSESHSVLCCFVIPVCTVRLSPPPLPLSRLFIQQWDLAVVTVVAAHLALRRVQVGRVGEGRREGVIVGVGVARRGKQGLGILLG